MEILANVGSRLGPWLDHQVGGLSVRQLGFAFAILFVTLLTRRVLTDVVLRYLRRAAARTAVTWDEALIDGARSPIRVLILAYGIWLAALVLLHSSEFEVLRASVQHLGGVLFLFIGAWLAYRLVGVFDEVLQQRGRDDEDWIDLSIVPLVSNSLRLLVIITFGLVIAQNLGYSITGIVASLGLGGAALALASKDTLANLFGSFMIIVDKPFSVGDWIKGDGFEGTVEEIGFRSTRIRTFAKTVENIPNNVIANVTVENMDRRKDAGLNVRRIKMMVGVTYATSADQMERALGSIREILRSDPGVDQRMTTLVRFTDFGASSLDIFVYYFANDAGWDYYLSVRERVNLSIMRALEEQGLSIAFPTRSIHIESMPQWANTRPAQGQPPASGPID